MKRCDRCGHPAIDAVGTRQASLFDVPADPRATDAARGELRAGRVLCSACQRTDDLPGMAESDVASTAQAVRDLDGGGWSEPIDQGDGTERRSRLEAFPVSDVVAHVSAEVADAFGMRGLPNTIVDDDPPQPRRLRVIRGQTALSRFLSDCPEDPIGEIARPAGIRSPYSSGPTFAVFQWGRRRVFLAETNHGRFGVYEVPAGVELQPVSE